MPAPGTSFLALPWSIGVSNLFSKLSEEAARTTMLRLATRFWHCLHSPGDKDALFKELTCIVHTATNQTLNPSSDCKRCLHLVHASTREWPLTNLVFATTGCTACKLAIEATRQTSAVYFFLYRAIFDQHIAVAFITATLRVSLGPAPPKPCRLTWDLQTPFRPSIAMFHANVTRTSAACLFHFVDAIVLHCAL